MEERDICVNYQLKKMKVSHSKPCVDSEDAFRVSELIKSGAHAKGHRVKEFEDKICGLIGTSYAKATTSGTTALHLALLSLGTKEGDEVIIPSYVCQAVLNSVNYTRAKPVISDIDNDYNISARNIISLITKNTKAIIAPHMFGNPANIEDILSLGIPVIEDCAQSLGSSYKSKKTGSLGDIGIFSFYATKIISTGQGGMVVTSSPEIKEKLESLAIYDAREEYEVAYNYRMTDIQAALGISQLKKLDFFIDTRKKIARIYDNAFKELDLEIPEKVEGGFPFRYVLRLRDPETRELLEKRLKENNITAERPVFKPLHQYLNFPRENFPNTELAHETALSIPIYPALTQVEASYIVDNVVKAMKG